MRGGIRRVFAGGGHSCSEQPDLVGDALQFATQFAGCRLVNELGDGFDAFPDRLVGVLGLGRQNAVSDIPQRTGDTGDAVRFRFRTQSASPTAIGAVTSLSGYRKWLNPVRSSAVTNPSSCVTGSHDDPGVGLSEPGHAPSNMGE